MTDHTARHPELDPQLRAVLEALDSLGGKPMYEGTVEEARAFSRMPVDMRDPASLPELAAVEDITVAGAAGQLRARVHRPSADGARPTVVFFHGGGFVVGDLDTIEPTARDAALACDAVVVTVDYRLAPEHPTPAAALDAIAATRWIADHLADLGGSDVLGVAGDSAGGNLAAVVAQAFRDEGRPLAGQLLFYPAVDIADADAYPSMTENAFGYLIDRPTLEWFTAQYAGHLNEAGRRDPLTSPLHGDVSGVAPAIIAGAQFDVLRDQAAAYAAKLRTAGVPVESTTYPGLIHSFIDFALASTAARAATDESLERFRKLLHG